MLRSLRLSAVCGFLFVAAVSPVSGDESTAERQHPLTPAIEYAKKSLAKIEAVPGYKATFFKREVVGSTMVSQKLTMKIRHDPFAVYLFFENPNNGREVIYPDSQGKGNLLVHETGLAGLIGTLELSPTGTQAMSENRYPITMAGIANLAKAVIKQWEEETRYGEIEVKYFKDAKLGDMKCRVVETSHPVPRKQFKFKTTRLWIDEATGFPVRVQQFGFPARSGGDPPVVEDYMFTNIRTDVTITDEDFDTNNPQYNF